MVVEFGAAVVVVVGVVGATVVTGKSAEQVVTVQREKQREEVVNRDRR